MPETTVDNSVGIILAMLITVLIIVLVVKPPAPDPYGQMVEYDNESRRYDRVREDRGARDKNRKDENEGNKDDGESGENSKQNKQATTINPVRLVRSYPYNYSYDYSPYPMVAYPIYMRQYRPTPIPQTPTGPDYYTNPYSFYRRW